MSIELEVPFAFKDEAKTGGAKWDNDKKKWCCHKSKTELIERFKPIILYVPFNDKDKVKKLGARWDMKLQKWVIPQLKKPLFLEWTNPQTKVYLDAPFDLKDTLKSLGGYYNFDKKLWCILEKYIDEELEQYIVEEYNDNN